MGERILGIDPGLQRTGYAIIERTPRGPRLDEGGVVRSNPADSLVDRVTEIASGIEEILTECRPDRVALEQVFSHGRFPKTAILMSHARGAILAAIGRSKTPLSHYTPTQVKRTLTGSGRAPKEQMQDAIMRELQLKAILEPHDVADAAAMALCGYYDSANEIALRPSHKSPT
ncbi:crossover junction endodeoxyribonuclease RuvC [Stratiformator vulcanicus]|uniref:Crossover junction endodeoxyribonuclease RuvC n=1 Tax=Stratiformator vulcanicus TaxID=2527980 RepID=A0A517R3Q3_9PLAN|nr:crossover junction endodeoxyribonuclease RuvC [Stratiformator vulcanicus]QDT38525.1 Crossover junction endodeoxyribonuclease RuvC [Stratiformator vulcanicus]